VLDSSLSPLSLSLSFSLFAYDDVLGRPFFLLFLDISFSLACSLSELPYGHFPLSLSLADTRLAVLSRKKDVAVKERKEDASTDLRRIFSKEKRR